MRFRFSTTCILLITSTQLFAWGFRGHILIGQIAYDSLSTTNKTQASKLAKVIYTQLPELLKQKLTKKFPHTNHFAILAMLPDTWRDQPLSDIFSNFHATLPKILQPYANDTTNSWHYINQPIKRRQCKSNATYNILWAINTLETAWKQTNDTNSKAVIMVFLEHLVGDIHQPLHTISRYNKSCQNDLGGNDLPIKIGTRPSNLHALWDLGAGYFFRKINFENKADKLILEFPKSEFDLNQNQPTRWAHQNLKYAKFIYSVKAKRKVPSKYYRKAQYIVRKQVTLAGYRLAALLTTLFE